MSALPTPPILTSDGSYEITGLIPGQEYLLTFKGFLNYGTLTLQTWNDAAGFYTDVDNGQWDGTDVTEVRYIAPSTKSQLVLAGAYSSASVCITHLPIR